MSKIKIFNDPIYGLISFPFEIIYELIDHPYFQRLRRIAQVGLSSYVYPGATHTRFHHAMGATHLSNLLLNHLKLRGIPITDAEHEACLVATLLHDIGHGPFSHALERTLIPFHHEEITIKVMQRLNVEFDNRLDLAISIFTVKYHKKYLSQILSSQLDVDRMDYLNRDSYYTGVAEGVIGYERIIKMMTVVNGELVVEEKGLHSVEKFIITRHLMYHQIYLHKTSLAAEQMLNIFVTQIKNINTFGKENNALKYLLSHSSKTEEEVMNLFLQLDDYDIMSLIKSCTGHTDIILKHISNSLLNRRLFRAEMSDTPFPSEYIEEKIAEVASIIPCSIPTARKLVAHGYEQNMLYNPKEEIHFLTKHKAEKVTFSSLTRLKYRYDSLKLHYLSYPKEWIIGIEVLLLWNY